MQGTCVNMGGMLSRKVTVANHAGIHARPADLIAKCARGFESSITLVKGAERVDAKNIWALLTLAATQGTELEIIVDGPDADGALEAVASLVASDFSEDHEG